MVSDKPGSTDLTTPPPAELPAYRPGEAWDTTTADQVFGHDLAKNELFDALANVPFMITRITTRPGAIRGNPPERADYMSCEIVIAPEAELRRRRIDLDALPFRAGDLVVFNDGSTGIYRQLVLYLSEKGFIVLPEGATEGGLGETIYDLPARKWTDIRTGIVSYDVEGNLTYSCNLRLFCPRGIRRSEYPNPNLPAEDAYTRYLA